MKRIEQRARHEVLRPHHARGPHEEAAAQPRKTEARQLRRKHEREREPVVDVDLVVLVRHDDRVECVRRTRRDVRHDEHEHVFLDVPRAWVERELERARVRQW